jgi:RNA polymerase sigma-70 factor (ECF subfamily)
MPDNAAAWLTAVARNRALDIVRRDRRIVPMGRHHRSARRPVRRCVRIRRNRPADPRRPPAADLHLLPSGAFPSAREPRWRCGRLCGLSTREIARAFVEPEAATAQRLVARRRKIAVRPDPVRGAGRRTRCPRGSTPVLEVIYLVFTEGYTSTDGDSLLKPKPCAMKRSGSPGSSAR